MCQKQQGATNQSSDNSADQIIKHHAETTFKIAVAIADEGRFFNIEKAERGEAENQMRNY